jgi:hypothetical protein
MTVTGLIYDMSRDLILRDSISGPAENAAMLGTELAGRLMSR